MRLHVLSAVVWFPLISHVCIAGVVSVLNDHPTIQAAIDAAVDGDEIEVAPGTYVELLDFLGTDIFVRSTGGPDVTILDGMGAGTVVICDSGEGPDAGLEGFTIVGGEGSSGQGSDNGGGLFVGNGSELTVTNCVFQSNHAPDRGGAVDVGTDGTLHLVQCLFLLNTGANRGGALSVTLGGDVLAEDCEFLLNTAGVIGGAIVSISSASGSPDLQSNLVLVNCTFEENSITGLGHAGAVSNDGTLVAMNCSFVDNAATESGGAIVNFQDGAGSDASLLNCAFFGNTADQGGAITNNSRCSATNCLFSGNASGADGSAVRNFSELTLVNCTFHGNQSSAKSSGAVTSTDWPAFPKYELTVSNCVFRNNAPDQLLLIDKAPALVRYSNIEGGWPGPGNIEADPLFVNPLGGDGVPGTPDDDLRLSPMSPCIDAADNTAVPEEVTTDLAGAARLVDDPATTDTGLGDAPIVDMGAYEFQVSSDCPQDLDGSGDVGFSDLLILLAAWEESGPADLDGSGQVGFADLLILLAAWGTCG